MKTMQEFFDITERRLHKRIWVQAPVKLVWQGTQVSMAGTIHKISWDGALLTAPEPPPPGSDRLQIDLPWARGQHISIHAAILRIMPLPNGQCLVATRFSDVTPDVHLRLEKLLKMLGMRESTAASDEAADVLQELKVVVSDIDSFRQILEQIEAGKFILYDFNEYDKHRNLILALRGPDHLPEIRLRARVGRVEKIYREERDKVGLYLIELDFEYSAESVALLVAALLGLRRKMTAAAPITG